MSASIGNSRSLAVAITLASLVACHRQQLAVETYPGPAANAAGSNGYVPKTKDVAGGQGNGVNADYTNNQTGRVEDIIQGRFPGVEVVQNSSGGFTLTIRGNASFLGNSAPLIVVDGVALQQGANLGFLNPQDIARIDLLKNPSETAIYGVRGGNGVIVISTKRAH